MRKILNRDQLCAQVFETMFSEFLIGGKLSHPGIVQMMFFFRKKNGAGEQELHILQEFMEGGNALEFLKTMPEKRIADMSQLKNFIK